MKAKANSVNTNHFSNLGSFAFVFVGLGFAYWCWSLFLEHNDRWAGAICCDVIGNLQAHSSQPSLYRTIMENLSAYGDKGPVPNQYIFIVITPFCWTCSRFSVTLRLVLLLHSAWSVFLLFGTHIFD